MLAIELPPDQLLAAARDESFDQKLDADLETISEAVLGAIPQPVDTTEIDNAIIAERAREGDLNSLWVVKSAFSEAESLVNLGEVTAALTAIESTRAKIPGYNVNQLLARDLSSQLDVLRSQALQQLETLWTSDLKIETTPQRITLHLASEFNDHWELYKANGFLSRFSSVFEQLYAPLVAGNVSQVEEKDGHALIVELGPSSGSAYELIDMIQTFFLELSSLAIPDLFTSLSQEYGSKLAKDVASTLTRQAPLDKAAFANYKSEVLGLKGLEEVLSSIGWTHSKKLAQFAGNFSDVCDSEHRAVYLDRLRVSLKGTFKPQTEDWDWDEDEEDEVQQQETEPVNREPPAAIIQEYHKEYNGKVDSFVSLFIALAPAHYHGQQIYLYIAAQELQTQIAQLPCTNLAILQRFTLLQLDTILQSHSASIDAVLVGPLSSSKASTIAQQIDTIAAKSAPAGAKVRTYILSSLVEKVCATTVDAILAKTDIAESESTRLAAFVKGLQKLRAYFEDIDTQVPTWIKLQRLGEILSQNLMGIHAMYDNNMLVDFSSSELVGLVEALFAESDMREQLLDMWR